MGGVGGKWGGVWKRNREVIAPGLNLESGKPAGDGKATHLGKEVTRWGDSAREE